MKTSIEKTFQVGQPIDKVWEFLSDPNKIVVCVPGAQITEQVDSRNYKGVSIMKFGPVSVKYKGEIFMEKLDAENYEMRIKGKGLDSKGKGSADMTMNGKLTEKEGDTEVHYRMEVSVVGMLAQFGSRMITDVSKQLVNQFVTNFKNQLEGGAGSSNEENSLDAAGLIGSVVKSKISDLFGKKEDEF